MSWCNAQLLRLFSEALNHFAVGGDMSPVLVKVAECKKDERDHHHAYIYIYIYIYTYTVYIYIHAISFMYTYREELSSCPFHQPYQHRDANCQVLWLQDGL